MTACPQQCGLHLANFAGLVRAAFAVTLTTHLAAQFLAVAFLLRGPVA